MERLTKRDEYGNADIIGVDSNELQLNLEFEELNKVTDALNRFAEYEDTGLTPEQVRELKEQNEVLADTVNMLSPMMMENKNMKTYIRNGVELGYIDDKEGDYKKYLQREDE